MPIVRRQGDANDEDHTEERHPAVDWKLVAPRWFLLALIGVLCLSVGWLAGLYKNLSDDRLARIEATQSDSRWDMLIRHTEQITELQRGLLRHEAQLEKLAVMAEDVRVLRRIAEAESARKKRSGGYGL